MHEIRWHGRGGQGAVTSSKILADAAFRSGWSGVTAAPSFGAERRGAPVTASTRLAREEIRMLSQVTTPDVAVVLDDSLLAVANATAGMKPGGIVLVNTTQPAEALGLSGDFRVVASDVTGAAEAAGRDRRRAGDRLGRHRGRVCEGHRARHARERRGGHTRSVRGSACRKEHRGGAHRL